MSTLYRLFYATPILLLLALAGCNTTAGFGEDVEAAGDAIEGEAEENKPYS